MTSTSTTLATYVSFAQPLALLVGLSGVTLTASAQNFAPVATYLTGANPQTIAVADVNGDELPDLLTANSGSNSVGVLLNQRTAVGTFPRSATTYASGGNYPVGIAVGDVNSDGLPDMVLGNQFSEEVSVLLNTPSSPGTFQAASKYATGTATRGVALGDFNGDGRLDIVATSSGATVGVLLNSASGPGTFLPSVRYSCGGLLNESVAVGDIDGDSRLDIVVSNNNDNTVSVLLNSARSPGAFNTAATYGTGGQVPRSVTLGDINGDGRLDIVVANTLAGSTVGVLLNSATSPGTFPVTALTYSHPSAGAVGLAIGDIDGDRRADIVTANYNDAKGTTAGVLLNMGTTPFATMMTYPSGGTGPHSIALADLNLDGRPDLALVHLDGRVGVLLNTATPLATSTPALMPELSLYPNPASDKCVVGGMVPGTGVQVLDALGRLISAATADATKTATLLLPTGLSKGVYIVRIGSQALRLVVK
jgi:hypothetical protein